MFERFIRLSRARKSLRDQRFFDALQQAADPVIAKERRAEAVRAEAVAGVLQRVEGRLERGDIAVALAEAKRLRQLDDGEAAAGLLARCERAAEHKEQVVLDGRATAREFRELVEAGALTEAEGLLAASRSDQDLDLDGLRQHLAERRRQAADLLGQADQEAQSGRGEAALEVYLRSLAVDGAPVAAARAATLRHVAEAVAAELCAAGRPAGLDAGGLEERLGAFDAVCGRLPELRGERAMQDLEQELGDATRQRLREASDVAAAAALGAAAANIALAPPEAAAVAAAAAVANEPTAGARAAALLQLEAAAGQAGFAGLQRAAAAALAESEAGRDQLAEARALLESGELEAARARFVAFLEAHPMDEGARKDLELLDQSLAELDRRLADVRLALRAGRLREVCTVAMSLVGAERIAAEAQQMLGEARARMALVDKGVGEVRVALHGRSAASIDGVRHCLKKLQELGKVQVDHEALPSLVAAVEAEIAALEQCAAVAPALERGDLEALVAAVPELVAARSELLSAERIDAKLCGVGDAVVQLGGRALEAGQLARVQRCGALLEQLGCVRGDFAACAAGWRQEHDDRERRVAELLREAKEALAGRDLQEAERCVEQAQGLWRESAEAQAFAHQLGKLRKQTVTLEEVAAMTDEQDFVGAQQKLSDMAGVAPMLRTRVFDMKRDLAKAQGLEGAFLLRVDEGGEQLVMRGESVSIGNLRKASADLPVLASLAGRHASIRRSMSFHGGMEDKVVAEEGEVHVGQRKVSNQVLESGDVVRFGAALSASYQRPSARSLTSRLVLQGGFQVAGTDRVLLMKDRGRDGRILLGAGRDVHVTVPSATGEVELYANNSGQMRVFCEAGGSIDGTVFKGEHPVAAGQIVEAAGITFLLLPWSAGS